MASLEELKAKYQSVLTVAQDKHVQMANLRLQDGKLFMKGHAPTLDAANAVWNEVKRINPNLDDVIADFPIESSAASLRTYKVKAGDTLSKISKQFYGNANECMRIFNANKDKLKDPNEIEVGQELKIPPAA